MEPRYVQKPTLRADELTYHLVTAEPPGTRIATAQIYYGADPAGANPTLYALTAAAPLLVRLADRLALFNYRRQTIEVFTSREGPPDGYVSATEMHLRFVADRAQIEHGLRQRSAGTTPLLALIAEAQLPAGYTELRIGASGVVPVARLT